MNSILQFNRPKQIILTASIIIKSGNYALELNATEVEITLPDKNPMLYVIFLEVKDRANNVRQARRFVLFDQSSVILKNNIIPFKVTSASIKANLK
jgi:hypothetical protein